MPSCQARNFNGLRCGRDATDSSYFWFFDQLGRINRTFRLCQDHSNDLLNVLLASEIGYNGILKNLKRKIDSLKHDKEKGHNLAEQREAIKNAIENGKPRPKFISIENINKEIAECYRRYKKYQELKNKVRNHTCRYCDYELKTPDDSSNQKGNSFSHADFHSGFGYRREVILFHTECGITWIMAKMVLEENELKYVRPKIKGQNTLFNTLTKDEVVMN